MKSSVRSFVREIYDGQLFIKLKKGINLPVMDLWVRSITLDTWLPKHFAFMQSMGIDKSNKYWEAQLPPDCDSRSSRNSSAPSEMELKWSGQSRLGIDHLTPNRFGYEVEIENPFRAWVR
ncbi:hypothetical protein Ddye_022926 [Dipteronia dyeriana]|uniref:Arf-GAP domain-containing protein n=1 Tax=Dipteronia dyeriana TaxID=168575 RepID=A0AAD9WSR9_9ROSI|nr:hypothetical protein Ddye_022926 [Dipteronia dyeriana]